MSEREDRLNKEEIERLLREEVLPKARLETLTSHENPKAIVLAGQPGAGKGMLANAARVELGYDALIIDPDEQRERIPGIKQLQESDPYGWPTRTNADAFRLAGGLRDAGVDARVNLIIDGSMSDAGNSIRTIQALQKAGYDVEIRAISAHWFESELGIDERFARQMEEHGVARDVDMSFHNRVYGELPDNLQKVSQATGAPALIYDRELNVLYDSRRDLTPADAVLRETRSGRMEDPEVQQRLRDGWSRQQSSHQAMPETIRSREGMSPGAADALIAGHAERGALERAAARVEGIGSIEAPTTAPEFEMPRLSRAGTLAGMAGLGGAAAALDAQATGERLGTAYAQDNPVAVRSEATQFIARGIGGVGASFTPAAMGVSGGPALALAVADAYLLTEAYDRGAKFLDRNRIVFQTDREGVEWEFTGKQWIRDDLRADLRDDGVDRVQRQTFAALPDKARELSYLASIEAVSQTIGKADPRDPFVQPANDSDPAHLKVRDWTRDADSGQWSRMVADEVDRNDAPQWKTEDAGPVRAAELDRQALQVIDKNITEGPAALAAQYQVGHKRSGFDTAGEEPPVVKTALNPDTLEASNGKQYWRDAQGQWSHDGDIARGNTALELEATRERLIPALQQYDTVLAQVPAWQAPTPEQQDRAMLHQAYVDKGLDPTIRPEQFEASYLAVQRTREATGVTAETTSLVLGQHANGTYTFDSPIQHLRQDPDKEVRIAATTTPDEITLALNDVRARERIDAPLQASPEQTITQVTPEERDAREQAQREGNRQGLSQDQVQQVVQGAAATIAMRGASSANAADVEAPVHQDDASPARQAPPSPQAESLPPPPMRDPRDPDHPDHRHYKQIERGVTGIDTERGRTFDAASERLTMSAFHNAKAAGIISADHIALNKPGKPDEDGSYVRAGATLFIVEGRDPSDAIAKRSMTDVAQAVERPVEQSIQKVNVLEQQQQLAMTQQQDQSTQDNPGPKGPRL